MRVVRVDNFHVERKAFRIVLSIAHEHEQQRIPMNDPDIHFLAGIAFIGRKK